MKLVQKRGDLYARNILNVHPVFSPSRHQENGFSKTDRVLAFTTRSTRLGIPSDLGEIPSPTYSVALQPTHDYRIFSSHYPFLAQLLKCRPMRRILMCRTGIKVELHA